MRKLLWACLAMLFTLSALPLSASEYAVDYSKSSLGFSGTHAGTAFEGKFTDWKATIRFDPQNLSESTIAVEIDTASATTGNSMHDGTLPTADWFDVKQYPKAHYASTSITQQEGGQYLAEGTLTIRDKTQPVQFSFALTPPDLSGSEIKTAFTLTLDRLAYDIGAKSDPNAEWVSKDIPLRVTLVASAL